MARADRTEISFEAELDPVRVLDGYCVAHGTNRTAVMRKILGEWAARELHAATVIVRTVGINPTAPGNFSAKK